MCHLVNKGASYWQVNKHVLTYAYREIERERETGMWDVTKVGHQHSGCCFYGLAGLQTTLVEVA